MTTKQGKKIFIPNYFVSRVDYTSKNFITE
jgi:hypothetical protein